MILKDKDIPDSTVLKLVSKLLARNKAGKGFRLKTKKGDKTITYDEVIDFVDKLAEHLQRREYIRVRRCDTCGNFNRPGLKGGRGCCFPKDFTCSRVSTDYCSGWIPMSAEQKRLKEAIDERFKTIHTE